jgi:hypothetical protein
MDTDPSINKQKKEEKPWSGRPMDFLPLREGSKIPGDYYSVAIFVAPFFARKNPDPHPESAFWRYPEGLLGFCSCVLPGSP